jgi:hypothetical protein
MYCPQCAIQNTENAKFCRKCGTDLEAVSLVLTNKLPLPAPWFEKHAESKHQVTMGAILLAASLLIAGVPALFVEQLFLWVMLWTVFFGWLACWGIVSLALGVGGMVKSRTMLGQMKQFDRGLSSTETSQLSSAAYEPRMLEDATKAKPSSPSSVTERTTDLLGKPHLLV